MWRIVWKMREHDTWYCGDWKSEYRTPHYDHLVWMFPQGYFIEWE